MSFQIRTIALYSEDPTRRPRELNLKPGALNVITGASKTGKSSLLDIVDYCMGSSGYPVAVGVVREHVRAFALLLQRGSEDGLLVVRFAPRPGKGVSTQYHIRTMRPDGALPGLDELSVTSDIDSAKAVLSAFAGIEENLHEPETGSRRPLRATIRHSLFFCLQGQDEVASRNVLFHGQADEHVPQAMRDVIPFFLGAVAGDHLAKLNRLRVVRKELKNLQRGADERRFLQGPSGREQALFGEAVEVGLAEPGALNTDRPLVELLADAMGAAEPDIDLPGPSAFEELNAHRLALRDEYVRVQSSLANLRLIESEREHFADRAEEQRSRLSLGALFGSADSSASCPVCASELDTDDVVAARIASELADLQSEITSVSTTTPELESLVRDASDRLVSIDLELRENKLALDEAERGSQLISQSREAAVQRATVRGRISLFLSARPDAVADGAIDWRLEQLESELRQLEEELDSDEAADRLRSVLSRVSANITNIADRLELEHSGLPTRLDIRKLTVIADSDGGPVPLDRMGSGENWLGYHLATMLGLHRFFVESVRPVPRFLVLDQPSQVYFPPDVDDSKLADDEDRQALERMLGAAQAEVDRHDGALQIIIVDHADLDIDWFQRAVLEKWRGGAALVPESWLHER